MNYISSSDLINELENEMSMYFNTGKVDKSSLPAVIRSCLVKIGVVAMPSKECILEVSNFKAKLPNGLYRILEAMCCLQNKCIIPDQRITTETKRVCEVDLCERSCDICRDECGNMFKFIQRTEDRILEWTQVEHLNPSTRSAPFCDNNCFKFKPGCPYEFDIKDGYFHANFEHGMVYLYYKENLENEEGFSIPDFPEITEWIKQSMIVQLFKILYRNGEDVRQKLDYEKNELRTMEINAKSFYTTSGVNKYLDLKKVLSTEFIMLENSIYASYPKRSIF